MGRAISNRWIRGLTAAVLLMGGGACASRSTPSSAPSADGRRNTHELLNAVLWVQTAAEYRVLAETAYRRGRTMLDAALGDASWTAALEQAGDVAGLPPAVILDVDETVLDNTPAEGRQVRNRAPFDPAIFDEWVAEAVAGAVPGAVDFIRYAESRGVAVRYVTNRSKAEEEATVRNLRALGLTAADDTVLCQQENGWTGDKTARRAEIARTHRILMLVGDDLGDFLSVSGLAPDARSAAALAQVAKWDRGWVLLPNPMYGSWERALYPGIRDDAGVLGRKMELVGGERAGRPAAGGYDR